MRHLGCLPSTKRQERTLQFARPITKNVQKDGIVNRSDGNIALPGFGKLVHSGSLKHRLGMLNGGRYRVERAFALNFIIPVSTGALVETLLKATPIVRFMTSLCSNIVKRVERLPKQRASLARCNRCPRR